jgi:hypothetical protein
MKRINTLNNWLQILASVTDDHGLRGTIEKAIVSANVIIHQSGEKEIEERLCSAMEREKQQRLYHPLQDRIEVMEKKLEEHNFQRIPGPPSFIGTRPWGHPKWNCRHLVYIDEDIEFNMHLSVTLFFDEDMYYAEFTDVKTMMEQITLRIITQEKGANNG